ncbi:MAG: HAD family hydrolase [Pseudobdellovibrionaceae bacterium]
MNSSTPPTDCEVKTVTKNPKPGQEKSLQKEDFYVSNTRMTQSAHVLEQILLQIRDLKQQGRRIQVVFDLDSTLFDVSPRLQKILMDFANHPEYQQQFSQHLPLFQRIQTEKKDWGIRAALIRAGYKEDHPDFHNTIRDFWVQHFFSNSYLHYDLPYAGAQDYVNAVAQAGAEIVYLTGRDQERMAIGSEEVLKRWNFPLQPPQSELALKPHKSMDDAEFKKDWFLLNREKNYDKIWFFENEPVNIHLIDQHCAEVDMIFLDTTHAGKAEAPLHLPTIVDFIYSSAGESK